MNHKQPDDEMNEHHDHIISYNTYILVWLSLVGFTAITVTIAGMNFGGVTLLLALLIAVVKSSLVLNIFMHIKFDDVVFRVFITVGVMTLASAILGTYSDYLFR